MYRKLRSQAPGSVCSYQSYCPFIQITAPMFNDQSVSLDTRFCKSASLLTVKFAMLTFSCLIVPCQLLVSFLQAKATFEVSFKGANLKKKENIKCTPNSI